MVQSDTSSMGRMNIQTGLTFAKQKEARLRNNRVQAPINNLPQDSANPETRHRLLGSLLYHCRLVSPRLRHLLLGKPLGHPPLGDLQLLLSASLLHPSQLLGCHRPRPLANHQPSVSQQRLDDLPLILGSHLRRLDNPRRLSESLHYQHPRLISPLLPRQLGVGLQTHRLLV